MKSDGRTLTRCATRHSFSTSLSPPLCCYAHPLDAGINSRAKVRSHAALHAALCTRILSLPLCFFENAHRLTPASTKLYGRRYACTLRRKAQLSAQASLLPPCFYIAHPLYAGVDNSKFWRRYDRTLRRTRHSYAQAFSSPFSFKLLTRFTQAWTILNLAEVRSHAAPHAAHYAQAFSSPFFF